MGEPAASSATDDDTQPLWLTHEYKQFRQQVALRQLCFFTPQRHERTLKYFAAGPEHGCVGGVPLLLLPGLCASAETYYRQLTALGAKGYRLVAVEPEDDDLSRVDDWLDALEGFLAALKLRRVHVFGAQLGGFLAQLFAHRCPQLVASLVLCNTFCDTAPYAEESSIFVRACSLMPDFALRRRVARALQAPRPAAQAPAARRAAEFVQHELEQQPFMALYSKFVLNCTPAEVPTLPPDAPLLADADGRCVTVITSGDECSVPQSAQDEVLRHYPRARVAQVVGGGDFPYLARADEVNMLLEVHIRGVEHAHKEANEAHRHNASTRHHAG